MPKSFPMPTYKHETRKPKVFVPPFSNGDTMDQPTFHRLYEATPDGFKAELIGGIVYTASPVTTFHGLPHGTLSTMLGVYAAETDAVEMLIDTTAIFGASSEPQPDLVLVVSPEVGGQTSENADGYITGAPELVIEISNSSAAIDLHAKKRDYNVNGVREYIVIVVPTKTVHWFLRGKSGFKEMKPDAAGVLKSKVFPGLWLLPDAVFDRRATRLLATLREGLASPEHAKFAAKLKAKIAKKAK